MNYQSGSRNHRTNGFKAKQAFKFAILLALCIWLLYQYKNPHDTTKDKHIKVHIKLGEEHSAMILGWQRNEARYSIGSDSNSKYADSVGEKSDEEETFLTEKENNRESITSDEEKQDWKHTEESNNEKPESNEENNPGIALRVNKDLKHGDQRLRANEKRDSNETQKVEEGHPWTLTPQKDEAYEENIEDKDHAEETGIGELEDGFHRFQDENGVPEDVDHILESMPSESSTDKKSDLLHERTSRTIDNMPKGGGREIMSRTSDSMPRGGRKLMSRTIGNMHREGGRKLVSKASADIPRGGC